ASRPLVIDPVLAYSTYLGGANHQPFFGQRGSSIAVDQAGNVYLTGSVETTDFPVLGPQQRDFNGFGNDAFVTKLNPAGQLVYSTYLGGHSDPSVFLSLGLSQTAMNDGFGIAVNAQGDAVVVGQTQFALDPITNHVLEIGFPTIPSPIQPDYGG